MNQTRFNQSVLSQFKVLFPFQLTGATVRKALIGLYVIAVLGFTASARAEAQLTVLKGQVVVALDQTAYLVIAGGNSAVELRADEDLTQFHGWNVEVLGEELKHRSGPVYQTQSLDPLLVDEERLPTLPVVVVHDIGVRKSLGVETR